jgi:S1-C subfamily serine protease
MSELDYFTQLSNAMSEAVEKASHFTVLVNARRRLPGTGIVYKPDLIVTANHIVEIEEDIQILLPDGQEVKAQLAGRDAARDLALLRLNTSLAQPAMIAQAPARVGQMVLALARPDANGLQATLGVVSALGGPVRIPQGGLLEKYIRTDAAPFPGFSGGPLINSLGEMAGLNTSAFSMDSLIAIPANIVWEAAATLAAHGHIPRGYLGIKSQAVKLSQPQKETLAHPQESALLLIDIEANSPSAKANLMVGDILVSLSGVPVYDHDSLQEQLLKSNIGQSIPAEVLRGGQLVKINLTLEERK